MGNAEEGVCSGVLVAPFLSSFLLTLLSVSFTP
jgi:hypothetical protein